MNEDKCNARCVAGYRLTDGGRKQLDILFDLMSDQRRRYVLYYLRSHKLTDVESLAVRVAAWERECSIDAVPDEHRDKVITDLHHTHLPKLMDASIIEYDSRSQTVRFSDPPVVLKTLIDLTSRHE